LDKSFHEIADELLKTLYSGMRWDLSTFSQSSGKQALWGCRDDSMFDWYCFTVAGCVGRFWARAFGLDSSLELLAVEYGKALQRINVIRDVREDWDRGRVYLPQSLLAVSSAGKAPWEDSGWKSFCDAYMKKTRAMLQIGANFCDAIPFGSFRLRYASILPLAIGWKTLGLLEENEFWKNHHNEYSIQLSFYALILEEWGFEVGGAYLVHIGPGEEEAELFKVKDMRSKIKEYLQSNQTITS